MAGSSLESARAEAVELAQYKADGVAIARQFFAGPDTDDLKNGWAALKAQLTERSIAREARFVWGSLPEPLASLYRHDKLVKAAQELLGTENVALYMNRLLLKR